MATQAVVTGMGQRSSLGQDVKEFWSALVSGQSGIRPLEVVEATGSRLGAALGDAGEDPDARLDRALRSCIREALADAGLELADVAGDAGFPVVLGSNFGDCCTLLEHGDFFHSARVVLSELGLCGEVWGLSMACASGVGVLGLAHDLVKHEGVERVLACAYDIITPHNYGGLSGLRAISPDTIRPFDKRRSGTLLGEAAGALVVESAASARDRGVAVHGRILGYGIANDAYHFTAPEPTGLGMRSAMSQALRESGLGVEEIGHVNAHGTGTPHNDRIETQALRAVFGEAAPRIPITSIKAAIGHTMGAAGLLEAIATILSVREGVIPPTLNHQERDPECDLDYVFERSRRVSMDAAMSNSYGLWGCNSSVIVGRLEVTP